MPKILIIDHEQEELGTISALFEKLLPDSDILTARSGAEGTEKAKKESPDIILLATEKGETDGLEVCKRLESDEDTKYIPVIMLTTSASDPESRFRGLHCGASALLTRPVDETELVAQVKALLRIRKAEDYLCREKALLEDLVEERTRELRDCEERSSKFGDFSTDGFLLFDASLNVLEINKAALKILGLDRDEVIGKNAVDISPDLKESGRYERYLAVMQTGDSFVIDDLMPHPTLGNSHLAVRAFNVGDGLGIVVTDITARKHAEEEKRELETMLQQAQRMEAIGTLAGGIAHDFNNILTAIIGYTELAAAEVTQGTQMYSNLQEVVNAGHRARDLVKQLTTFSRQSEHEKKPFQISLIVKEALKMLQASLPTTIKVRQQIQADSGKILADPSQIYQMLMNLCTNSAHAMSEEGGVLEVRLEDVDLDARMAAEKPDLNPGPYLRLAVSDTGHGISPTILRRIFDPYFTTKEIRDGAGLGLAVVHGIVKSHGGGITVYSERGQGTTINIFLPRIQGEASPEKKVSQSVPRGKERILFVDDDQALAHLGKQILERLGYEVISMTSSIEGLKAFSAQPAKFDLVITDLTMPDMTGLELAKKLLAIRADIPIILCSGFGESVTKERAEAVGIREFVMKPIIISEIGKVIRKVLGQEGK